MKEVVEALESDPEFRKKLNGPADDIRSGNIAHELEYVDHKIRTKLDEIKREEIERLRSLVKQRVSDSVEKKTLNLLLNPSFLFSFNWITTSLQNT